MIPDSVMDIGEVSPRPRLAKDNQMEWGRKHRDVAPTRAASAASVFERRRREPGDQLRGGGNHRGDDVEGGACELSYCRGGPQEGSKNEGSRSLR